MILKLVPLSIESMSSLIFPFEYACENSEREQTEWPLSLSLNGKVCSRDLINGRNNLRKADRTVVMNFCKLFKLYFSNIATGDRL